VDGAAGAGSIVKRAVVVVAPLEEDHVAAFDEGERFGPLVFHDVGAAAATADGAVVDVDFGGVEELDEWLAPAPLAAGSIGMAIANGGVADEKKRGQAGIGRWLEPDLRVGRRVSCGAFHARGISLVPVHGSCLK